MKEQRNKLFTILVIAALMAITAISSCKKISTDPPAQPAAPLPANFKEIKAADQFSWSTSKRITFEVRGMASEVSVSNTLIVKTVKGEPVMMKLHAMSENYSAEIEVPSSADKLVVIYGDINKTFDIT